MPALSNLHSNLTLDRVLNWWFRGVGLQMEGPGQAQYLNLVRLVDKTVREYEHARQYFQEYVGSGNKTSLFMRCVDHMENCIDSLHRVFLHLEGLKASLYLEQQSCTDNPVPHISRKTIPNKSAQRRVKRIRRAMQHMDERISQGRAGRDKAPIGLLTKSDSIELDEEEIYFTELASWIEQLYKATEQLVNYAPSASQAERSERTEK